MTGHRHFDIHSSDHPLRKGVKRGQRSGPDLHPLRRRGLRAQNLVEFALFALILLAFTGGIVGFGAAFQTLIVISNAAREGARYGVRFGIEDTFPIDGIYELKEDDIENSVNTEIIHLLDTTDGVDVQSSCVCRNLDLSICPSPTACVSEETLRVMVTITISQTNIPIGYGDYRFGIDEIRRDMEMMIP